MSSITCSVRGCYNNWNKRREFLKQLCYEHKVERRECCGARYDLHPPPREEERLKLWLKALDLPCPPKRPYVCSFHFVDGRPTEEHPYPERWLGQVVPVKKSRRTVRKKTDTDIAVSVGDAEEKDDCTPSPPQSDVEDRSASDHNYAFRPSLRLKPLMAEVGTQFGGSAALYSTLLRTDSLCQLYTGLSLVAFNSVAEHLTAEYENSFQLQPRDQLLMTLMKLRLNLLQGDLAERFGVSQTVVSEVIACWLDVLEEKMRCFITWLPRETIQETMPQCFKEHFPKTICVIDCSETPLQKPHNVDWRGKSNSPHYGQNTMKYLVSIAPCGLIMFISSAYRGRFSDAFIASHSGFLEYLCPGDEVMVHSGFTIQDLLFKREVTLTVPAFTRRGRQLSEEDTSSRTSVIDVQVHVERVTRRLKNFKILSQTIPMTLAPKADKILRICAALCNLQDDIISDVEEE